MIGTLTRYRNENRHGMACNRWARNAKERGKGLSKGVSNNIDLEQGNVEDMAKGLRVG